MHFTTNFEISLENFLNVLGFLLLTSEKNGGDTFLHRYFLVLFRWSWYMFLLLEYFSWFVQVSAVFERLVKCYFAVPISLKNLEKIKPHTHRHTPDCFIFYFFLLCFFFENHGKSFFWNHLFLQFNSRINRGFYFCE